MTFSFITNSNKGEIRKIEEWGMVKMNGMRS